MTHDDQARKPLNPRRRTRPNATDIYEQHTLFERALEAQGRFSEENVSRVIQGGSSYPKIDGPLTTPQADHGYDPDRDRIEFENITPTTYGQDVSGRVKSPEYCPAQVDNEEACDDPSPGAAPSSSFRRGL